MIRKGIAIFPVDEDFLSLPNNQRIKLGEEYHQISYYITLSGWNIDNRKKALYTLDEFDFKCVETLVLINSFRMVEDEIFKKVVSVASKNKIKIVCARDDMDIDQELFENMCVEENVECEFVREESILSYNKLMNNIETPVVMISGVGPYVDKFKVGLYLKNSFEKSGYRIIYLSPRREGKLFGTHIFPEYMYMKDFDFSAKVFEFNGYINKLVKKEKPDIVLIGVPGETMELSDKHKMNFGIMANAVFNAVKPDVSILNMYNMQYTDEFLEEQKKYCKYRFGMVPDLFYVTYTGIIASSLQEAWIQYFHTDRLYDDMLEKYKLISEDDVKQNLLFEKIVELLEEYGSLGVV